MFDCLRISDGQIIYEDYTYTNSTIGNIQVSNITGTSALITWTTLVPATSQLLYGLDEFLPFATPVDTTLKLNILLS